ncbi:Transposase [Neochlamydia sp. TUME1]|nr:Transposase [Neochlamydia sp. TUME1]
MVVDKKSRKVICTAFSNGKKHDYKLFKESKVRVCREHTVDVRNYMKDEGKWLLEVAL